MKKINLNIKGMHCSSCEQLIKDTLEETKGIKKATISKESSSEITFDSTKINKTKIAEIIKKEGYELK